MMKRLFSFFYNELPEVYGSVLFIACMLYWQFSTPYWINISFGFVLISIFCAIAGNIETVSTRQRFALSVVPITIIVGAVLYKHGQTTAPIQQLDKVAINEVFNGQEYTQAGDNLYVKFDPAAPKRTTLVYHADGIVYRVEVRFDKSTLLAHQENEILDTLNDQYGHRYDFSADVTDTVRSDGNNHLIFDGHRLIAYNIRLNAKWYGEHAKQIGEGIAPKTNIERIISG